MIFLTTSDFKPQVKADVLERIVQNDPAVVDQSELSTIQEMSSYLGVRYDTATIFSRTGTDRNALIVMYAVDILLYHIHSRLNPNQIPQLRIDRYDMAIAWLKAAGAGTVAADLPGKPDTEQTTATGNIIYSGDTKRSNRF